MDERSILVLLGSGANNAVTGLMMEFANALAALGVGTMNIELDPPELQLAVNEMAQGRIRFALCWLGVGQHLSVQVKGGGEANCWEALRVPLVKIHADSPAYFSDRHRNLPTNGANLYMAREFLHFRRRWLPSATTIAAVVPPFPIATIERKQVDLRKRRQGSLVFLKNGNSPLELQHRWRSELSPRVNEQLCEMAAQLVSVGLKPGALYIGDFVGDYFESLGYDPRTLLPLVPFFTAQLDDYLRRVKSEMIAKAILDLPVIVQGDAWGHVDFKGRRAEHRPGEDFHASHRIFRDELGVIDMSPNIDTEPHDRVMRAAGSFATVLTSKQSWLREEFPGFADMAFEFEPEAIEARVADMIGHPDRYLELGVAFGERFREIHPPQAFARKVLEVAELASLAGDGPKPQIQDFFIWPAN